MSSSVLADAATLSFDALAKLDIKEAIVAPKSVAANALVDSIVAEPKGSLDSSTIVSPKGAIIITDSTTVNAAADIKLTEPKNGLDSSTGGLGDGDKKATPVFATEIMTLIIKFAMTADPGGRIIMPCLTGRMFEPKIAVGLLRVNHAFYHEALHFLYTENQFFFDNFGSDLGALNKPVGVSACLVRGCSGATQEPHLKAMRFELGSNRDTYMGNISANAFQKSLKGLRRSFFVEKLTLHFHIHSFLDVEAMEDFVVGLERVEVTRILILTGPASHHYGGAMHRIAASLGMLPKPTWSFVLPARSRDYGASISDRGFSYYRFKADNDLPDYDDYEGKLIQEAVAKGAHIEGSEKWV